MGEGGERRLRVYDLPLLCCTASQLRFLKEGWMLAVIRKGDGQIINDRRSFDEGQVGFFLFLFIIPDLCFSLFFRLLLYGCSASFFFSFSITLSSLFSVFFFNFLCLLGFRRGGIRVQELIRVWFRKWGLGFD